jgi:hypothetical protein
MKFRSLIFSLSVILMVGCSSYHLGEVHDPGFKKIYIENFRSEIDEPELENLVSTSIVQQFQKDGTIEVTDRDQADVILRGTIDHFELTPMRYSRQNELTTTQASMTIGARYTLTKKGQSTPYQKLRAEGSTLFFVGSDIQSDKRQGVPLAAQDLGRHIVTNLVDGW